MPDPSLVPDRAELYVQTGAMFDNPHGVPRDEVFAMISELPLEVAAQVCFGRYVESSGLVFSADLIQMLIDRDGTHYGGRPFEPMAGNRWVDGPALEQARLMTAAQKRTVFASGVDFARITDYTVIFTLDVRTRPARVVSYRRLNRVPWEGIYREVGRTVHQFGPAILADATGMAGDVILDALEERHYCPVHDRTLLREMERCHGRGGVPLGGCKLNEMVPLSCVDGFQFTKSSKQGLIEHLRSLLSVGYQANTDEEFGWLRCPPLVQLEEELAFYAWDDKGLDTDTVMGLALACWQGLELSVGETSVGSPYGS